PTSFPSPDLMQNLGSRVVVNHTAPPGVALSAPFAGVVTRFRVVGAGPLTLRTMQFVQDVDASHSTYSFASNGPTVSASGSGFADTFAVRFSVATFDAVGVDWGS